MTGGPARKVERRLSVAPTPTRMMNILEAEGGTKIATRLVVVIIFENFSFALFTPL